ncbi:hypothetical protein [Azorhizobium doebereinerae]|uniref:hypothetical protein n=1 Tax=Azorhizobium doebereinerae TaxID=281091 RepID=UPI0004245A07|nr:hypothetical protein [Azorhizobium doebereinerae]
MGTGPDTAAANERRAPLPASLWLVLGALLASSYAVKLAVFHLAPNMSYADVTFQYLEQAHQLMYGRGLLPWEFVSGARPWLVPGLILPGMEAARLLGGQAQAQIFGAAAVCSLVSLLVIPPAFLWGWRAAGTVGAVVCGAIAAYWFETVYYAGQPLQDTIATFLLVPGVYLAYPDGPARSFRRLVWAGLFLGAALAFRIQLGPIVLLVGVWVARLDIRRYAAFVLGGIGPLLFLGLLDWATWGMPFQSIIKYVKYQSASIGETGEGRFGFVPWYHYPGWILAYWSGAFALIVLTAWVAVKRLPLLLAIPAFNLAVLELIAMKHPRYLYPGVPFVLVLSGIGGSLLALRLWEASTPRWRIAGIGFVFVALTSGLLGGFGYFAATFSLGRGTILATRAVNADPASCGLAIAPGSSWWLSGGYVYLNADKGLYGITAADPDFKARNAAFNYILATTELPGQPLEDFAGLGFEQVACFANGTRGPACLWKRPGTCTPGAAPPLKASLPPWLEEARP